MINNDSPTRAWFIAATVAAMFSLCPAAQSQENPATRPSTLPTTHPTATSSTRPSYSPILLRIVQRFSDALAQLNLTREQKQQVKSILADARQQAQQIVDEDLTDAQRQQRVSLFLNILRQELRDVLNGEQVASLEVKMAAPATQPTSTGGPKIGEHAPDFHIEGITGQHYELAQFKGHVVVVEFGSLTCPMFRQNAKSMNKLYRDVRWRAWIMVVYTRENFPADGHQTPRNIVDGIEVPQAKNLSQRITDAQTARDQLQIALPIAVDSIDNPMVDAYGSFPNGAVIISKDGKVFAREQWTNADSLRRIVDEANKN